MRQTVTSAFRIAAAVVAAMAVLNAVYFAWLLQRLPKFEAPEPAETPAAPAADEIPPLPPEVWQAVRAGKTASAGEGIETRFRLAGTFFLFGDERDESAQKRAVIDDLARKQQLIVREGDEMDGFRVVSIAIDRVELRRNGDVFELSLSFTAAARAPSPSKEAEETRSPPSMEDMPALETTRFGKRVGENRWVVRREELLRYYGEVMEDAERLAAIYASLKPKIEEGEIGGYRLDPEGERDFFRAVGLREGDIIRRVNSMRMVSQRRAEYFLSEFLRNRISALVIDVEREGREEKLIYLIR